MKAGPWGAGYWLPSRSRKRWWVTRSLRPKARASNVASDAATAGPARGGAYRLADLVGEGTFGDDYLARDLRSGQVVAIKVLHPQFARDPAVVRRFFDERRAASALTAGASDL